MTKINKDAVYVLKQPEHSVTSIIVVEGDSLPLTKQVHENIDKLSEISDIVFIFSDRLKHNVNMKKFSMLYRACAFTCGSGKLVGSPLVSAISYSQVVFQGQHCYYLITSVSRLNRNIDLSNVAELCLAGVKSPILEIERLSAEELKEIYMFPSDSPVSTAKSTLFYRFLEMAFTPMSNDSRCNSTHRSSTPIIFINGTTMRNLIENMPPNYLETFVEKDYSFFIASLIRKLGIKEINADIMTLTVGKLVGMDKEERENQ